MVTELKLRIGLENNKSVVTESSFTSPLKLGLPNHEDDRLKVVLMMASAGILKGDEFEYHIYCASGTKTFLTDQSYTKIFDTGDGMAKKRQNIQVKGNASLYYFPCAVIPFRGSSYEGDIIIKLDKESEFVYADILSTGRIGMGECLAFHSYRNRVCVEVEERPVWLDQCLLLPDSMDLKELLFFDEYTHQGTFYFYGKEEKQKQLLDWNTNWQKENNGKILVGMTEALQGVCMRVLAHTAQEIEELFAEVAEVLE